MWRIYGGAVAVIAGIAAFTAAHSHQPIAASRPLATSAAEALQLERAGISLAARPASGLSPTAYDLLRIGGWALLILGAITVVLGLVRYWAQARTSSA